MVAYFATYIVMVQTCRTKTRLRRVAWLLFASSSILAFFSMLQALAGVGRIYGFYALPFGAKPFGPFTNRNHYAAYMNMALGLSLALVLTMRFQKRPKQERYLRPSHTRRRSSRMGRQVLLVFGITLIGASVFLSLSRGGIASLLAASGISAVVVVRRMGAAG